MYSWLLNCMIKCMLKHFYTSLPPFCLLVFLMCDFLLLRWSSIYWCEQMWEPLVVISVMEIPLLSLSWVGSPYSKFSFKALCVRNKAIKERIKERKNRHREFNVVRRTMCMPTSTTTLGSIFYFWCISKLYIRSLI